MEIIVNTEKPTIPTWSPEEHIEMMRTANVKKSILSISSPGTNLYPGNVTSAIELTRQCNAYAADLKKKYPYEIGFWASLPLPDVSAALKEIDKAAEEGCDGFVLMTNYDGNYIGDKIFDPIFAKLNELGAAVFIHPTTPCMGPHSTNTNSTGTATKALPFGNRYPAPIFEFFFDTARAVINLFYTGTVTRSPNVKFALSHVGGAFPPLINRFTSFSSLVEGAQELNATQVREQLLRQFYFDITGTAFDGIGGGNGQLKAFVEGFDIPYLRLLYGSDFPFTSRAGVLALAVRMKNGLTNLFDEKQRAAIYEGNAARLLEEGKIRRPV